MPRDVRRALGRYHALVVGNDAYPSFPRDAQLQTAANDAREVARTLKEQYDFQVTVLLNATRQQLMSALNEMRDRLTEKDNFLLYYAGHGKWDEVNKSGHWVPVDGHPADSTNWIHTRSVTEILNLMAAQQVLVVADACYAGSLAIRGGIGRVRGLDAIRALARERSRVLLASGGIEPVLDRVSGRHSVFAKHFLQVLRDNGGVLTGVELFDRLRDPVATEAQGVGVAQSPQYSLLQFAGHQGGDFLFVRAAAAR